MKLHPTRFLDRFAPLRQLRVVLTPEDWRQLVLLFAAMLAVTILQVTGVASILPFMQLVSQPGIIEQNQWMHRVYDFVGFESQRQMLFWVGIGVFALFTGSVAMTGLLEWLVQRAVWNTAHRLCMRQLRAYMHLPYEFFLSTSTSDLLRRIVTDVNKFLIDVLLAESLMLAQAVLAAGLFTLMFFAHQGVTLTAIVVIGGMYVLIQWFRHSLLVRMGKQRIDTDDLRYSAFVDAVSGMKSIRVADASDFFVERFETASRDYSHLYPRFTLLTNVPRRFMEIVSFGGILVFLIVFIGTGQVFAEVVPTLSLLALATYRLMPALHVVFESAARLSSSLPVIESIARDLTVPHTPDETRGNSFETMAPGNETEPRREPLQFNHEIRLKHLSFRYAKASAEMLKDIDIRIARGSRVALVGSTGSGKTTVVDLTVGLLLPSSGALLVDGIPIARENIDQWRQLIAYVPQDVFMYAGTVADNIFFGNSKRDREQMREAARIAQIDDFIINGLDQGYDTTVGERGVRLSGGERQRIGIARALYRCPKVLLLDEATSALDNVTEANVVAALHLERRDTTVVTVAHRLSTVRTYDHIYLLDRGVVADEGTFEALYDKNQQFRRMVDIGTSEDAIHLAR